ncbi:MAG: LysM peptidoglycan-binding domain-containing protein [Bilifractor sp.]
MIAEYSIQRDASDRAIRYRSVSSRKTLQREERRNLFHLKKVLIIMAILLTGIFILFHFTADQTEAEKVNKPVYKYYTSIEVQRGESLWSIATDHMSPEYKDVYEYMSEIAQINHLRGDQLDCGQKIIIPYYSEEYKK